MKLSKEPSRVVLSLLRKPANCGASLLVSCRFSDHTVSHPDYTLPVAAPFLRGRAAPLNTDHHSSVEYNSDIAASTLFTSNGSCILSPEVTLGPYWVEGEYLREDVSEDQAGIALILDAQILDISTCDPITDAVLEIWSCNSTGVYSGVVARGNGVGNADPSNLQNTFMRGLQPTDDDGVAQFTTLFPGHYTGRATHIHVLVHFNGTSFDNGTYAGGYVSHVGQLYFDQSLISEVEATSIYATNTQDLTTNADDNILSVGIANGHDPFVEYSYLRENCPGRDERGRWRRASKQPQLEREEACRAV